MPIARELRAFYRSPEWEAIRERILVRDRQRCKFCTRPNGQLIATRIGDGPDDRGRVSRRMFWRREDSLVWMNETGWRLTVEEYELALSFRLYYCRVQLGVAHLDHDWRHNWDENLAALCRWCHLMHDRGQHRQTRALHKDQARPLIDLLFPEPLSAYAPERAS